MNINDLMSKVQEMQTQMQQMRHKLDSLTVMGEAGGGMVKATATANRVLTKIEIEPAILNDREMVQDLVVAAVNQALDRAAELAQNEMGSVAQHLMPNIPGMPGGLDLSKFGL
jgi:DNA-binding YbaB/EbfC family protein